MLIWNLYAAEVDADLHTIRRPAFMQPPATLPIDPMNLYDRLRAGSHSKATATDKELYADFMFWKERVIYAEAVTTRNLETICCALYWSEKIGDESLSTRISRLRSYMKAEYGVVAPVPCPENYREHCQQWGTDRALLPTWMLTMERPSSTKTQEEFHAERESQAQADRRVSGHDHSQVLRRVVDAIGDGGGDVGVELPRDGDGDAATTGRPEPESSERGSGAGQSDLDL